LFSLNSPEIIIFAKNFWCSFSISSSLFHVTYEGIIAGSWMTNTGRGMKDEHIRKSCLPIDCGFGPVIYRFFVGGGGEGETAASLDLVTFVSSSFLYVNRCLEESLHSTCTYEKR
jgi:hypothetical protein